MKTILFILLFITGTYSQVLAQQGQRSGMAGMPGVQQLIIQHGDDLQLTEDQKRELMTLNLQTRKEFQRSGRMVRQERSSARGNRQMRRQSEWARGDSNRGSLGFRGLARMEAHGKIREILTDEQAETLQSIMIERAEKAHNLRMLRHELMVEKAEIEAGKAGRVLEILNGHSENRLEMVKRVIENPNEVDRDDVRENFSRMIATTDELKNILTAAEYEKLQPFMGRDRQRGRSIERRNRVRNR